MNTTTNPNLNIFNPFLTRGTYGRVEKATTKRFLAAASSLFERGDAVCGDTATGLVVPAHQGLGLIPLGVAEEMLDLTGATGPAPLNVDFLQERTIAYFNNGTGADEILPAEVFGDAYFIDSRTLGAPSTGTVNGTSVGRSKAGRILVVGPSITVPPPAGTVAAPIDNGSNHYSIRGLVGVELYK